MTPRAGFMTVGRAFTARLARRKAAPYVGSVAGVLLLLLTVSVQVAPAQSLGDVARREAERRKQTTSGQVYTNADLAPVDPSARSVAPIPVEAATGSWGDTPDAPAPTQEAQLASNGGVEPVIVKAREKRDEPYWRALARELRGRLAKATADVAARVARLAEIDTGPQTPTLVREREVIDATLSRVQRDARSHSEELTRFLTRAQVAKVPEEWTR